MRYEKQVPGKKGKKNKKNMFMRLIDWIAEGASKAERMGGNCIS